MKHLKTYNLFEKYGYKSNTEYPAIFKKAITEAFGWNSGIATAIDMIVSMTQEKSFKNNIDDFGQELIDEWIFDKNKYAEGKIAKGIITYTFGRNVPKKISDNNWEAFKSKWDLYYRGIGEFKWVNSFKYSNDFTGMATDDYQGVWLTKNINVAKMFSHGYDQDTDMPYVKLSKSDLKKANKNLTEVLILPDIKLISDNDIEKKVDETINIIKKYIASNNDKGLHWLYQLTLKFLCTNTFIAVCNKYDGINTNVSDITSNDPYMTLIIFNKGKLATKI